MSRNEVALSTVSGDINIAKTGLNQERDQALGPNSARLATASASAVVQKDFEQTSESSFENTGMIPDTSASQPLVTESLDKAFGSLDPSYSFPIDYKGTAKESAFSFDEVWFEGGGEKREGESDNALTADQELVIGLTSKAIIDASSSSLVTTGETKADPNREGDVDDDASDAAANFCFGSEESFAPGKFIHPPKKTPRSSIAKGKLGSIPDAEELERLNKESKRKYTIDEIVSTEETYYRRLRATWEVYVVPLRQLAHVPSGDIDTMFFMWENLMVIHKDFIGALTRDGKEAEKVEERLGPLFMKFAPVFKMYLPYMNNFGKATEVRTNLLLESKPFHEFCGSARKHAQAENQSLMDLMMEPIQRIPRYKLLLTQLLKYTEKDSPHHEIAAAALDTISETAKAIDMGIHEAQEAAKNHEEMIEIMMSFTWNTRINLIDDPARRLIKCGPLERQTRKSVKSFYFWLFNDRLVYGESVPGLEGIYVVHRDISLDACQARAPPPSVECEPRERALFIASTQKSFIVWAPSVAEMKEWEQLLKHTIEAYRTTIHGSPDGGDGVAPMWVPNDASSMCQTCSTDFSFFTSRHHCRKCGNIVCSSCSSFTFLLPNVDKFKESRVCDGCFEECVEKSGLTLTEYFEKQQADKDATVVGSLKNSINGLFGRRKSATSETKRPASATDTASAKSILCSSEDGEESESTNSMSTTTSTNNSRPASLRIATTTVTADEGAKK